LKKAAPQAVIIPAGWQNRFGFPHPEVVQRYHKLGSGVYITGENGATILSTDGRRLVITPMLPTGSAGERIFPDMNPS